MLGRYKNEPEQNNTVYQEMSKEKTFKNSDTNYEKTVIGEHISIEGKLRADEDLIIQGTLKGTIELEKHHITIGAKSKVEADIRAESMTISGTMNGNVSVYGKVAITKEADFTGQIKAKRVAIEDGAYINASIEMQREDAEKPGHGRIEPIDAIVIGGEPETIASTKSSSAGK